MSLLTFLLLISGVLLYTGLGMLWDDWQIRRHKRRRLAEIKTFYYGESPK